VSVSQKSGRPMVSPKTRRLSARQDATAGTGTILATPEQFKIVVADDSRIYRSLVETTLVQEDYIVLFAENGREALAAMAKHHPCLVVTDWEMPDISGIELCKKIRQDYESYVHIILLTSNTKKDQIVAGLAAGGRGPSSCGTSSPNPGEELTARRTGSNGFTYRSSESSGHRGLDETRTIRSRAARVRIVGRDRRLGPFQAHQRHLWARGWRHGSQEVCRGAPKKYAGFESMWPHRR
jgi:CheY-like chemotaxis protein/ribosome modulation factor